MDITISVICLVMIGLVSGQPEGCPWPKHIDNQLRYKCKPPGTGRVCDRKNPTVLVGSVLSYSCKLPKVNPTMDTINASSLEITCGARGYDKQLPSNCIYTCGQSLQVGQQVTTGWALERAWPWHAVLSSGSDSSRCTGAIIHPLWILTSSSCMTKQQIEVRWGLNQATNLSPTYYQVQRYIRYSNTSNDLVMLQIPQASLGDKVAPICLPDSTDGPLQDNESLIVTGYTGNLRQEVVNVVDSCGSAGKTICVKRNNVKDSTCIGDLGSLLVKETVKHGKKCFVLRGVKRQPKADCGENDQVVFSDVLARLTWIKETMAGWVDTEINFS